jgi:hypothetical protein
MKRILTALAAKDMRNWKYHGVIMALYGKARGI